jgi:hypothetical protein
MIVTKTIGFTIDIDTDEIAPATPNVFIFQLVNRLNYEHTIKSVTVDGKTIDTTKTPVEELSLGKDKPLQ